MYRDILGEGGLRPTKGDSVGNMQQIRCACNREEQEKGRLFLEPPRQRHCLRITIAASLRLKLSSNFISFEIRKLFFSSDQGSLSKLKIESMEESLH